jgi:Zn-dependent oligopeptidase
LRPGACESCVLPAPPPLSEDLPPFQWPRTADEIKKQFSMVEAASKQTLDAVAAVADGQETFANAIEPLMTVPHYKTNPLVCQAKFSQHCSTQPEIRAAADAAGTAFAALKARGRTRADVYRKVKAFSASAASAGLSTHNAHFVSSLLTSFERSGLGLLSAEEQAKLQELRDRDAVVCSAFKKNLAEDTTALFFTAEEL